MTVSAVRFCPAMQHRQEEPVQPLAGEHREQAVFQPKPLESLRPSCQRQRLEGLTEELEFGVAR